jgi:hypothetical protein
MRFQVGDDRGARAHLSHAVAADLRQASGIIASVVYDAANRAERPWRELPKAPPAREGSPRGR